MSDTQELKFGDLVEFGPWIAWGASHADELDDVMDAASDWAAVPFSPVRPKWEVTKSSGDTLVGVIEDAPPFVQNLSAWDDESLKAECLKFGGDGTRIKRFLEMLPTIIALVKVFTG